MRLMLLWEVHEKNQWSKELKLAETETDVGTVQKSDSPRGTNQPVTLP